MLTNSDAELFFIVKLAYRAMNAGEGNLILVVFLFLRSIVARILSLIIGLEYIYLFIHRRKTGKIDLNR